MRPRRAAVVVQAAPGVMRLSTVTGDAWRRDASRRVRGALARNFFALLKRRRGTRLGSGRGCGGGAAALHRDAATAFRVGCAAGCRSGSGRAPARPVSRPLRAVGSGGGRRSDSARRLPSRRPGAAPWYVNGIAAKRAAVCVQRCERGVRRGGAPAQGAAVALETTARRHLAATSYRNLRVGAAGRGRAASAKEKRRDGASGELRLCALRARWHSRRQFRGTSRRRRTGSGVGAVVAQKRARAAGARVRRRDGAAGDCSSRAAAEAAARRSGRIAV